MPRHMILVCHAADGHFADGNREAVRRVLDHSEHIACVNLLGREQYEIICADGGSFELYASGLDEGRSFHRMELVLTAESGTADVLHVLLDLMRRGGFGLMDSLETSQFIVTLPQQVVYFPWLPEPPLLVRNPRDLGHTLGHPNL
jgi:hypothetical protein